METGDLIGLLMRQAQDHAIILLDPQGAVVSWLAGSERIFGYSGAEMVGHDLSALFTPEDAGQGLHRHELEVARHSGRAEDDRWQVRKDGGRFWASGAVVPLRGPQDKLVGFGKILRDRTDLKEQLEALQRRIDGLIKVDEHRNLFLATLAHELRNPLAALLNAPKIIRLAVPDHPSLSYPIKLIERQVDFLKRLADDLLDTTRIGTGKVHLQNERVDLRDVLNRVTEMCRPKAQERKQTLHLVLPPAPIPVDGDPSRLQQVFVNLLSNATKYTPEAGQIWITATTEGDEAVVRVQDTGVGIAPEMLPRIFDLFTQEASSRALAQGGLGIGLSLVKELVHLHGGTVQVRSEGRGKGSEFTVRVPLALPAP